MNQAEIKTILGRAKEKSPKRNFSQTYDFIIALKGLDLKKQPVDFYATLHYGKGKKSKICALVGPELADEAKKVCDQVILVDDFARYQKDKKLSKKLAAEFDYFIAQANIMAKVATAFGRVFGPRGRMPNPKAGCVVPPKANLQVVYDRLQKTVRISAKTSLMIQLSVGTEAMKDEEIIDNILTIYDQLIHHLPNEKNNIKSTYLKTTMGKIVKFGEDAQKSTSEPAKGVKKPAQKVKEAAKEIKEPAKEIKEPATKEVQEEPKAQAQVEEKAPEATQEE